MRTARCPGPRGGRVASLRAASSTVVVARDVRRRRTRRTGRRVGPRGRCGGCRGGPHGAVRVGEGRVDRLRRGRTGAARTPPPTGAADSRRRWRAGRRGGPRRGRRLVGRRTAGGHRPPSPCRRSRATSRLPPPLPDFGRCRRLRSRRGRPRSARPAVPSAWLSRSGMSMPVRPLTRRRGLGDGPRRRS